MLITVPLPPRGCSSNGDKGSWRKKATATKLYRQQAWAATVEALGRKNNGTKIGPVRMSMVFCTKGVRAAGLYAPRDVSNAIASFKAAQDGICDALQIPDSHQWLQQGRVDIDNKRGPYVLVTIESSSHEEAK